MDETLYKETGDELDSFEDCLDAAEEFAFGSKIKENLSKEKISHQVEKFSEKAKKVIDNPQKVSRILEKAISLCDDMGQIRFIGKYFREASVICRMVDDYICRRYTKVPTATVLTLLGAVLYFAAPIDIIPDFIPLIGHMDDMSVFMFVRDAAKVDIKKYKKWKKQNEIPATDGEDDEE